MARDADDVAKVLAYGRRTSIPVTFRAGGTSLNGQGQTDGILVDVRRHFRGVAVEDDGRRARVQPGTVLGHVNRVLAPHGFQLGPDPASTDIACVGGVIANNSGGMRCGVTHDSYETVRALTFVLPSGTVIDSAAADAERRFADAEPELAAGLLEIRDEILADEELTERIRRKFAIKNTTGYRLCAFLDAETPVEIFRRLLVGSEGTLGFIAEAVFETVPQPPRTTVSWLHFAERRRRDRAGPRLRRRRRPSGRADGRPGADRRQPQHPRDPGELARARPVLGRAAGRVRRRRRRRARRRRGAGGRGARRPRADPRARVPPRRGDDRGLLDGARGHARPGRQDARARDRADRRGRLRAARRRWPRWPRTCRRCSPSTASSPGSPATPRRGTCTSCSPRTSPSPRTWSATTRSWRG